MPDSVHNRRVPPLTFTKAREVVIQSVRAARRFPGIETADLLGAAGRVLAEDIAADRDTPPTARSVRDGFAIRAAEAPGEFEIIGEVRAGTRFGDPVEWRPGCRNHDRRADSRRRRRSRDGGSMLNARVTA